MLPSPTAAATRLTGLERTSPQAKMPGTLVSSRYGSRSSCQRPDRADRLAGAARSRARRAAMPSGSQPVSASAPMKTNTPPLATRRTAPDCAVDAVDRLELLVAVHGLQLAVQRHLDVRLAADLLDQVVRHALLERVAAHDQRDGARVVGEEHRRLARGVAGADQVDVLPLRRAGLAARGAVEHALAEQAVEAVRWTGGASSRRSPG